ncbi:alpha/beta hydrolase [Diaminobutyricibacter tongyongensis]|uniref:Alpha/beta hydrolase n=1 Tax=Leifsonia tongyongensis TaxID=1268043 RepID=A0A6L9XWU6_9MICO|nr:alpha/beta hydrolase [Diaminobutyricibacter tongyongensis]NEN05911.1 alpha/beta hydrolase [Diaminobutyricibacter tongyongensis]
MTGLLRNLGWWAEDYAYAVAWQARAAVDRTDPRHFETGSRRPVVMIPGVYEPWQFLRPLIDRLHGGGHPVFVMPELGPNHGTLSEGAATVEDALVKRDLREVIVVAHSKGGLIGKLVMLRERMEGEGSVGEGIVGERSAPRVARMIAICTPFAGSRYAQYMPIRALRDFSPLDPAGISLRSDVSVNARIVSIFGPFDPHIPEGSELPGATNRLVARGGHFRGLSDPEVQAIVLEEAGR